MNIDQLRYLILIDLHGSINKASEQAHISQQAMNVSMTKLEDEIGCPLFHRHARGMSLTENGQLLRKTAEEVLLKLDDTLAKMCTEDHASQSEKEQLLIFFSPAIGNSFIPNIMKSFAQTCPAVQPMLMEKESNEIISLIQEDHVSALGLLTTLGSVPESDDQCAVLPIFDDKLYIALAKDHPLAKQKSVSLRTILKYPLTIYQSSYDFANPVCQLLEEYGTPNYHTITNNLQVYQNAILNQNAIGFINKSGVKNHTALPDIISEVLLLPIKNIPPLSIFSLMTQSYLQQHSKSIHAFINIYKSLF